MKANYMIGDWVRNDLGEVQRIVELRETGAMLSYNDIYDYEEIEPVSLTPEILKKNGFTLFGNEYSYLSRRWDIYVRPLDIKEYNIVIYRNGVQYSKNRAKYVHQLQQALRPCGIRKDIKLP